MRYGVVAALLAVAGLGLTGCGNAEQAMEKVDVKQAAAWVDDAEAVQVTISLDADPAALKEFAKTAPKLSAEDQAELDLLADAKVVLVGSPKGEEGLSSATVQLGGKDVVSVVGGGEDLYLKIDAAALPASLTSDLGTEPAQLATMLDLFAPGAGDALRNQWVRLDSEQVKTLAGEKAPKAEPTPDAKTAEAVTEAVKDLLGKATIVDDPSDPTHKVITVKGDDIEATLNKLGAIEPGGMSSKRMLHPKLDASQVPETITVDAYVTDGDLSRVSVDLTQFDDTHKSSGPVRLDLAFAEAAPVVAPSDAKDVDISKLAKGLLGQFSEKLGG